MVAFWRLYVTPESKLVFVPPVCPLSDGGGQTYGLDHARQGFYLRGPNLLASQTLG